MNDAKVLPIPAHKNHSALCAFRPENLLRETRRQTSVSHSYPGNRHCEPATTPVPNLSDEECANAKRSNTSKSIERLFCARDRVGASPYVHIKALVSASHTVISTARLCTEVARAAA
jgi:hypothetical protein